MFLRLLIRVRKKKYLGTLFNSSDIYLIRKHLKDYFISIFHSIIMYQPDRLFFYGVLTYFTRYCYASIPLNESRPLNTREPMEYFIDPNKYFLLMLIHEIFALAIGGFTMLATGSITLAYAQHTCGMLKIVR